MQIEEEEPTGFVRYQRFESSTLRVLQEREFVKPSEERVALALSVRIQSCIPHVHVITDAFPQTLDVDKKGYFEIDEFKALLIEDGEKFTEDEVKQALESIVDPEFGHIVLQDYVNLISAD